MLSLLLILQVFTIIAVVLFMLEIDRLKSCIEHMKFSGNIPQESIDQVKSISAEVEAESKELDNAVKLNKP